MNPTRRRKRQLLPLLLMAAAVIGCGTLSSSWLPKSTEPTWEDTNIYYWGTAEYVVQAGTFSMFCSRALSLAQEAGGALYSRHHFIVDDCYVFSFADKQLGNPLAGYYVNGVTGEVTRKLDVPEFTMSDFHRRWPDQEFFERPIQLMK